MCERVCIDQLVTVSLGLVETPATDKRPRCTTIYRLAVKERAAEKSQRREHRLAVFSLSAGAPTNGTVSE